jgi:uncharacterized integral membrane protein
VTTPDPRPATTPGTDPTLGSPGSRPASPSPTDPSPTGPSAAPPSGNGQGGGAGRTIGRTLALALLVFVTVVLVLFVMFNTQRVQISLVFTDVRAPLVVALLIAAVLGGLVVGLADALMTVRRRRNR